MKPSESLISVIHHMNMYKYMNKNDEKYFKIFNI